jgi:uncharacterized protein YqeY
MSLKETINADFMKAFKAKEMVKKNFLGVIKGEIQIEEGRGTVATDEVVLTILKKMEKSLKQTNTEESLGELEYIKGYLPQLMSESEIIDIVTEYIEGKGTSSTTNQGSFMKEFNANYKGKADNSIVMSTFNRILAGR